jgi:hypothetical protein
MAHIKMINEYQYLQYGSVLVAYCNQSGEIFCMWSFYVKRKNENNKVYRADNGSHTFNCSHVNDAIQVIYIYKI